MRTCHSKLEGDARSAAFEIAFSRCDYWPLAITRQQTSAVARERKGQEIDQTASITSVRINSKIVHLVLLLRFAQACISNRQFCLKERVNFSWFVNEVQNMLKIIENDLNSPLAKFTILIIIKIIPLNTIDLWIMGIQWGFAKGIYSHLYYRTIYHFFPYCRMEFFSRSYII